MKKRRRLKASSVNRNNIIITVILGIIIILIIVSICGLINKREINEGYGDQRDYLPSNSDLSGEWGRVMFANGTGSGKGFVYDVSSYSKTKDGKTQVNTWIELYKNESFSNEIFNLAIEKNLTNLFDDKSLKCVSTNYESITKSDTTITICIYKNYIIRNLVESDNKDSLQISESFINIIINKIESE